MKHTCSKGLYLFIPIIFTLFFLTSCFNSPVDIDYEDVVSKIDKSKNTGALIYLYSTDNCKMCIEQLENVNKVAKKLKKGQFNVIAISLNDNRSNFKNFLKQHPINFKPYLLTNKKDGGLKKVLTRYNGYYNNAIPYSAVMNNKGNIIYQNVGYVDFNEYVRKIQSAVN